MKKIELYLLKQILKSFFLIFFIFIGISWLLQISRLLNLIVVNKIPFYNVFLLSINVMPNTIISIAPFIIFITILFVCIKLNKDKELIAVYTLGINKIKIIKPFIVFSILALISSLILSFYVSPYSYENYKKDEFDLRTNLDIKNIGLNNFFDFNNEIILNFEKDEENFVNLFIFQTNPNKNIILAAKSEMDLVNNKLNLKLYDGFKAEVNKEKNEVLVYDKYNMQLNLNKNEVYDDSDTNTHDIKKLFQNKNFAIINQRFVDALLLLSLVFLITSYLLINLKFNFKNFLSISIISILMIFFDNILGNFSLNNNLIFLLMYLNLLIPIIINFRLKI